MNAPTADATPKAFNERLLLIVLAAIQFTTVVDFLIVMPLGPQYMRVFSITAAQFGLMVSAYAISGGVAGILASLFLDRVGRKPALLLLYLGFALGTLFCALASSYVLLVLARIVAGGFGGVAGALILAIIGDVIPAERRGAAMGMVMSAFSVASIGGVPLGLYLAVHFDWHVPFFALTALSLVVLVAAVRFMPSIPVLKHASDAPPITRLVEVVRKRNHQTAFLLMLFLVGTGFMIFPYLSNFLVSNVGLTETQLPLIYLIGGFFSFFTMNLVGRWADRSGKLRVFSIMSLLAIIPILTITNLPRLPVAVVLVVSTVFMVCMSGRFVPVMALVTESIEGRYRAGFMSLNSSVQQFASGLMSYLGGLILGRTATGQMTHFPIVGLLATICALIGITLARSVQNGAPKMENAV